MNEPIIRTFNLKKSYQIDSNKHVRVLKGVDLEIYPSDFCIIYGPSGSGKSTLLHHIAGLELPTSGSIWVNNTEISNLNSEDRATFRANNFGMVYQLWYWVKSLTVWENVALPLLITGESEVEARKKALASLEKVGIEKYAYKRPMQLSGGEQQRVGLARALINDADIIIADEPTGNLDTHSSDEVMQILQNLNAKQKKTVIMVTHNLAYLPLATREVIVKDGLVTTRIKDIKEEIRQELRGVI